MCIKKRMGLRKVPCGTPLSTTALFENLPSTTTLMSLFARKDVSQACMFPVMPYLEIFASSQSWGTVSKALEKSKIASSVWSCLSKFWHKLNFVANWVSQGYPAQKPWLSLVRILWCSKCFITWQEITCSNNLQGTEVNETGR